ncbi:hypothetical protein [Lysinibacillus sp. FN11]|uniref:hypothetical protein n=1 Tax=Lysinibacillus sp. FN11 TaxID=2968499 RepID=UPI00214B8AC6|nr:hypothetical protein [Lysinibacillus sp. FN11]UUV26618.1 hypothetical protein NP781_08510 [Lysinibacillus sp. FN11]
MTKGKQYKRQSELAELATDLSPDDLDVREENALTQEQKKIRTKKIVQKNLPHANRNHNVNTTIIFDCGVILSIATFT